MQSWYNQSIAVDPANANHVLVGLEEVYETSNGGSNWTTVDPYWNFYFKCWAPDSLYPPNGGPNRCPLAPHTDQHSMTIGKVNGVPTLFIGNDGGVYSHRSTAHQQNGNGDDWNVAERRHDRCAPVLLHRRQARSPTTERVPTSSQAAT